MEFPGVLKKQHVEISGSIKEEVEFLGVFEKNSCEISMVLVFLSWNFQGVSQNFAEFPWVKACFLWNF